MIIFTHIPKTSGTSFMVGVVGGQMKVQRKFHKKLKSLSPLSLAKGVSILHGHCPYGVHRKLELDQEECRYFTFLRDPVERWISSFYHCVPRKDMMFPIWEQCNYNLRIFMEKCLEDGRNTNTMVKQLSGMEDFSNVTRDYKNYMYIWGGRKRNYTDDEMEEMLNTAIDNLVNRYWFVGYQHRADRCYRVLCRKMGIKCKKLNKAHQSTNARRRFMRKNFSIDFRSKKIKKLLHKSNSFDMRLYEYACKNIKVPK